MIAAPRTGERGMALFAAVVLTVLIAGFAGMIAVLALSESKAATITLARTRALATAHAGVTFQLESVARGDGAYVLTGNFGGGTYEAGRAEVVSFPIAMSAPPGDPFNDCWRLTATANVDRETRAIEAFAVRKPYPRPPGAVTVQGPGALTAVFPLLGAGWRISGHDTVPPSTSLLPFDDISMIGNGMLGPDVAYGMAVHSPIQRTTAVVALALTLDPTLIDGRHRFGGSGTGANTVAVHARDTLDLAYLLPVLRGTATVLNGATASPTFGDAANPMVVFLGAGGAVSGTLTGYGILVLTSPASGIQNLHWEGLVIVYGAFDLDLVIYGNTRIFGALIHEDPLHLAVGFSATNMHCLYSTQSIDMAYTLLPPPLPKIVASRAAN